MAGQDRGSSPYLIRTHKLAFLDSCHQKSAFSLQLKPKKTNHWLTVGWTIFYG